MITEDMLIGALIMWYPQTAQVFRRYGLGCMGCGYSKEETIAQGAAAHGVDLEKLLWDLNDVVAENRL